MASPMYDPYAAPIFPQGGAFGTGSPAETSQQPAGMDWLMQGITQAIGGLAKRAFGASEEMRQGGAYNPAPAFEASMLPMGTGAIAGVPMRAGEAVLGAGPIRAYHGSPHDFDAFSLDKIGTGEGAQAYGHGLYFAENEGVAKSYRDALSTGHDTVVKNGINAHGSVDNAIKYNQDTINAYKMIPQESRNALISDKLADAENNLSALKYFKEHGKSSGSMYEVNINADPAHFLDWDKPLSQQSENVNQALQTILKDRERMPADWVKSSPGAEGRLREAGIPGIKYLDQGSRAAGEGSRNYVLFDDKLIDIMRKYGLLGLPAGGTAAPLFLGQEQKS